jgi:hypothetical protein
MMNWRTMILISSTLAIALSPVSAAPNKTANVKAVPRILSVGGFESIPQSPGCSGTAGPPVTIDLTEILKELVTNGKVTRKIDRKLAGSTSPVDRPANVGNNWPSNLDMELAVSSTPGTFEPNDYVMVTINLRVVRGVTFLRPLGAPVTDSSIAVLVEPRTTASFCGRTDTTSTTVNGKKYQTFSFGVLKGTSVHSVNIGIMVPDSTTNPTYWMPILLDPNVKNSG